MALGSTKLKLLFMGSDSFSRLSLKSMIKGGISDKYTIDVLSPPKGRRDTPIHKFHKYWESEGFNVDVIPGNDVKSEWKEYLNERMGDYDAGIVSSFRHMVPGSVIDKFIKPRTDTSLNFPNNFLYWIHPSLLPKYRGACPIQHTLLNADTETGVTLIHVAKRKFDAGNIVAQTKLIVEDTDIYGTLRDKLAIEGGILAARLLHSDLEAANRESQVQDKEKMTKAPLFEDKDASYLNFTKGDSQTILRTYKAFARSSVVPSTHIEIKKDIFRLAFDDLEWVDPTNEADMRVLEEVKDVTDIPNGAIHWNKKIAKNLMFVKWSDNKWLKFSSVRIANIGKLDASQLMINYFQNKKYKQSDPVFYFKLCSD